VNTTSPIRLYNSLTKKKETLKPIHPGKVTLYVCGVTVYDYCHIGHARVLLVFDMLVRFLESQGLNVTYIRNITDVDDKIIRRAIEKQLPGQSLKEAVSELTHRFIQAMEKDCQDLNINPPSLEPKATENIPQMLALITELVSKKAAYQGKNGDVYFDVNAFSSYGALSHRKLSDLQAGSRVEVDTFKNNPLDFVLWKQTKTEQDVYWDSDFGPGRPGWHIECSAMSLDCLKHKQLGQTLDIHGGGHDLKFPHHENERAQSEAVTGACFSNTWMHVGFVQINQEKMSKSLGNFLTIKDCLKDYHPEVLRYFMLSSHYRSPVEYSDEAMQGAFMALERLYNPLYQPDANIEKGDLTLSNQVVDQMLTYQNRFYAAMADDLNTPVALSVLFDLVKEMNRLMNLSLPLSQTILASMNESLAAAELPDCRFQAASKLADTLKDLAKTLGLLQEYPSNFLSDLRNKKISHSMTSMPALSQKEIDALQEKREVARKNKDFAEADRIRDLLQKHGVALSGDKKIKD
jgi:cysteinyl-tRNA synthetase